MGLSVVLAFQHWCLWVPRGGLVGHRHERSGFAVRLDATVDVAITCIVRCGRQVAPFCMRSHMFPGLAVRSHRWEHDIAARGVALEQVHAASRSRRVRQEVHRHKVERARQWQIAPCLADPSRPNTPTSSMVPRFQ